MKPVFYIEEIDGQKYVRWNDVEAVLKEKDEGIKCLSELVAGMNRADLKQEQAPTLHDRYTMAALAGLLANTNREGRVKDFIVDARVYADEAMKQRGEL